MNKADISAVCKIARAFDVISFPVDSELYSLMLLFEACLTYHTDATGIDMTMEDLVEIWED